MCERGRLLDFQWGSVQIEVVSAFHPLRRLGGVGTTSPMGKRSGVPHRDDELAKLSEGEISAELARAKLRLTTSPSAKVSKRWHKRIHWLEAEIASRKLRPLSTHESHVGFRSMADN